MRNKYEIWTDGSCYNNKKHKDHGKGGWAFSVVINEEIYDEDLFYERNTTSARMEMIAFINALKYANRNKFKKVKIFTDYETIVKCLKDKWYMRWIDENWYGVKNPDLWKTLLEEFFNKVSNKEVIKVKGHSGIEMNERVDYLAGEARKFLIKYDTERSFQIS